MGFKRRERILVITAVACLVAWAADQLLIEPLWKTWNTRQQRLQEVSASLVKGGALVARKDSLDARWREMRARSLPADVPSAEQAVFQAVSRWAGDSRLGLSSLKPRWSDEDNGRRQLELSAAAQGDLEQIARFIYELERDPLAFRVEDMDITARDNRGEILSLTLRFTGLVLTEEKS